ncbi:MAG: repressor LexA [Bacteroidales bacterium]|nr:repressor LexA [Bacteroidales bacterium]
MVKLTKKDIEAIRHIRNILMHKGQNPSVRDLMKVMDYKSTQSISIILKRLVANGIIEKNEKGKYRLVINDSFQDDYNNAETVQIPLVGLVACGTPIFAEENIEAYIPVSVKIAKPSNKYFILRAKGDSMNEKNINDGDLLLVKQQFNANNGDLVVALIDGDATVKEFHHKGDMILLLPRSTNKKHQPIILTNDFRIQGKVETVISISNI